MKNFSSKGIRFSGDSIKSCVGFIDLVDSTKNTITMEGLDYIRKYYSTFINSVSENVKSYSGKGIKNIGDCLLFYFPKTTDVNNIGVFIEAIECGCKILDKRYNINQELSKQQLPPFNYRISMDYGLVEVALGSNNKEVDLFGSVVNECAKINSLSKSNGLVIGKNLYNLLIKSAFGKEFEISEIKLSLDGYNKNLTSCYTIIDNRNLLIANKRDEALKHQVPSNEIKRTSQIENKSTISY